MCSLLARATLTIDRGARHRLRPTGSKHRISCNVEALLTHLHDAAHHHVVDERGVDVVAGGECAQHFGGQIDWVPVLQTAIALPEWGAYGINDDCGGHKAPLDGLFSIADDGTSSASRAIHGQDAWGDSVHGRELRPGGNHPPLA